MSFLNNYYNILISGDIMKDIFDEVQFGNLKLNSRIVRTGTWETETAEGGFLTPDI